MSDVRLNRCMELLVEKNHEIVRLTEELADYKRCSLEWGKQMNEHMDEIARLTAENERLQRGVNTLIEDCKKLEDVVEAARLTVEFGYPKCFTVEQVDRLIALEKAVHALDVPTGTGKPCLHSPYPQGVAGMHPVYGYLCRHCKTWIEVKREEPPRG